MGSLAVPNRTKQSVSSLIATSPTATATTDRSTSVTAAAVPEKKNRPQTSSVRGDNNTNKVKDDTKAPPPTPKVPAFDVDKLVSLLGRDLRMVGRDVQKTERGGASAKVDTQPMDTRANRLPTCKSPSTEKTCLVPQAPPSRTPTAGLPPTPQHRGGVAPNLVVGLPSLLGAIPDHATLYARDDRNNTNAISATPPATTPTITTKTKSPSIAVNRYVKLRTSGDESIKHGDDEEGIESSPKRRKLDQHHQRQSQMQQIKPLYDRSNKAIPPHAKCLDFIRNCENEYRIYEKSASSLENGDDCNNTATERPRASKTASRGKPAHDLLLLNKWGGGRFRVSDSDYPKFLNLYADDVAMGARLFISEQRSPVFKMHLDLDLEYRDGGCIPDKQGIVTMCRTIQSQTKRFYQEDVVPPKTFDMLILTAEHKTMVDSTSSRTATDENDLVFVTKVGVHIIFPYMYVDTDKALAMREAFLTKLAEQHEYETRVKPWEVMVDHQIYVSNGLRMIYSAKTEDCPSCKGGTKQRAAINACARCSPGMNGKIDVGRSYDVLCYVDCHGVMDEEKTCNIQQNHSMAVKLSSTRCFAKDKQTATWSMYPDARKYSLQLLGASGAYEATRESHPSAFHDGYNGGGGGGGGGRSGGQKRKRTTPNSVGGGGGRRTSGAGTTMVDRKDPRFVLMEGMVQKYAPAYKNVRIDTIKYSHSRSIYTVSVSGEGSRFCTNLKSTRDEHLAGEEHNNSNIYFLFSKGGLHQKCWCRCITQEGRLHGPCSNYKGPVYKPSPDVFKSFFVDYVPSFGRVPELSAARSISSSASKDSLPFQFGGKAVAAGAGGCKSAEVGNGTRFRRI